MRPIKLEKFGWLVHFIAQKLLDELKNNNWSDIKESIDWRISKNWSIFRRHGTGVLNWILMLHLSNMSRSGLYASVKMQCSRLLSKTSAAKNQTWIIILRFPFVAIPVMDFKAIPKTFWLSFFRKDILTGQYQSLCEFYEKSRIYRNIHVSEIHLIWRVLVLYVNN